jgi:transcriptional regulator with XRE-family HTH domain
MALGKIKDALAYKEPRPNKFTIFLGEQIKKARIEQGYSQEELAQYAYVRRATISDIENGKGQVNADLLALFGHVLDKPLGYFYPWYAYKELKQEDLTPLENELILNFQKIMGENLQKLAVDLVRVFGNYDPEDLVIELVPFVQAQRERREAAQKARKNRK